MGFLDAKHNMASHEMLRVESLSLLMRSILRDEGLSIPSATLDVPNERSMNSRWLQRRWLVRSTLQWRCCTERRRESSN